MGASQAKKVCVPQSALKFPVSLMNFAFPMRGTLLMWLTGSDGWGWQATPPPPPNQSDHRGKKRNAPLGRLGHFWYTNFWVPDPTPSSFLMLA